MASNRSPRRAGQIEQLEHRTVFAANAIEVLSGNVVMKEGDRGVQYVDVALQPKGIFGTRTAVEVRTGNIAGIGPAGAKGGSDYQDVSRVLTWNPGDQSVQVVRVAIYGDTTYEGNESFLVFFKANSSNTTVSKSQVRIEIKNDDPLPPPLPDASALLAVDSVALAESSNGNQAIALVHIKLREAQSVPMRVVIQTVNGTAISGTDYSAYNTSVIFEAGETEKTVSIAILGDNEFEGDETFVVRAAASGFRNYVDGVVTIKNVESVSDNPKTAVFRRGVWLLDKGDGGEPERQVAFGLDGDTPLTGDYNGDGKLDLAVVRTNSGTGMLDWYFDYSADGVLDRVFQFGFTTDTPIAGDFDGNGKTDAAVIRQNRSSGMLDWYIDLAGDGLYAEKVLNYGLIGDVAVAGDFDGNGRTDATVVRKNGLYLNWYIDQAGNGGMAERVVGYGLVGDVPIVGDWDGNGRSDFGVARSVPNSQLVDLLFDLDSLGGQQERVIRFGQRGDRFVSR